MAPYFDRRDATALDPRPLRVLEATYRIAARLPADAFAVPAELMDELAVDFSAQDRAAVVLMLKSLAPHRTASHEAEKLLRSISAPTTARAIGDARAQLLAGKAEAQARASLAGHPVVNGHGDPFSALFNDAVVASIRHAPELRPASPIDSPFLTQDTRRFSEIIEPTIELIQGSGDWNADMAQRRRVIHAFCWITGDRRLCDYGPMDAQTFAKTLRDLPTEFRWGTATSGNMARPVEEVVAEAQAMKGMTPRNDRTFNRDLTIMARFSRELAKVSWKPRFGKDLIVDFNAFTATIKEDPSDPDRMPWTEEQLVTAFSSPIYLGGGGCSRRYKVGRVDDNIWQDAAYWVPLVLAYTFVTREEACGMECEDFVFDVDTPFMLIKANMTRSKDGKKAAGLKRLSRYRAIPLHSELLRLGLQEYVAAMEAEGNRMIFPELYVEGMTTRGGKRFYASAGRYLLDYVDGITPLLRTSDGKRADLHSMRTAGGSALEESDAKQIQVDDIMGHAREGTGPRKYSRAWFFKGGAAVLERRLKLMCEATPNLTAHLQPAQLLMLPLAERSRTGSFNGCASRVKQTRK